MSTGAGLAAVVDSSTSKSLNHARWNPAQRIGFRFAFVYLILYSLPFPLGALPWTGWPAQKYQQIWDAVVPWVGSRILGLSSPVATAGTGSGDRMADWILTGSILVIALVATAMWSMLDRRRSNYSRLDQWLRLYARLSLAFIMMGYGGYKVVPVQFTAPRLTRLIQPYGESSPMGILWTFMGASPSYVIFTGVVEMVAGILLFIPRTAMLGATVSLLAMGQVFVLNMCYDVPVKLFSFHLTLISGFLLIPHLSRLANLFLLNRNAEPFESKPLFERRWLNRAGFLAQIVFGLYVAAASVYAGYQAYSTYGGGAQKPPLYGIWTVGDLAVNGTSATSTTADESRWHRAIFQRAGFLVIQPVKGANQGYKLELDMDNRKIVLTKVENPEWKADLAFEQSTPEDMTLEGQIEGSQTRMKLTRTDESDFLLNNRGFHWVNEVPFNK